MYPPRALGFALVAVLLATLGGQALAQEPLRPACLLGESVQVEWAGSYYDATVLAGPDGSGRCEISYDGWSSMWNEWVGVDRLQGWTPVAPACPVGALALPGSLGLPYTAAVVSGPDPAGQCLVQYSGWGLSWLEWARLESYQPPTLLCLPGQALSVESNGQWWNATAVSGSDTACRVHYDGWPTSRDETVAVARMRPRVSTGSAQPATPAVWYGPGVPTPGGSSNGWTGNGQQGSWNGGSSGQGSGQDHGDHDDCHSADHDHGRRGGSSGGSARWDDRERDDDRRGDGRRGDGRRRSTRVRARS